MTDFNPTMNRRTALRRLSYALGGIATAPLASGFLAGCRTPSAEEAATYAYQTLGEGQQRTLAALVDRIIPATDTPGAAEAGVPQFVDLMLTDWYAPEDRDAFLAALAEVDAHAAATQTEGAASGTTFADLDPEAQAAYVAALDAETFPTGEDDPVDGDVAESAQEGSYKEGEEVEREVAGMQGDLGAAQEDEDPGVDELGRQAHSASAASGGEGPSFYRQLKELTVAGYYTSEVGATQELRYDAVMGRYEPDVPLAEIGRAWA